MNHEIDWDQVVEDLGPRLFSYLRRRGCHSQASDLTQETLIRLLEKVHSGAFDPRKGSLVQLAFGIVRYIHLENRETVPFEELSDEIENLSLSQEDQISQHQKFKRVRKAILQLSPIQQEVMNLILEEQLKLEEISEILEIPVGTVKSHVARSKEKMKEILKETWEWL